MNSFNDFGLLPSLLKTLKEKQISKPTEIQMRVIPMLMSGQSVVGVSETGSGKTLAYALPLLHMLKSLEVEGSSVENEKAPRAIVMVPTRELGEQVSKVFKSLTHDTRLRWPPRNNPDLMRGSGKKGAVYGAQEIQNGRDNSTS
jgi:ATP-dependent RNA helicase RhlE